MKTSSLLIILVLCFSFNTSILAQESDEIDISNRFALQFQIQKNLELSGFGGAALSGKYCLNNYSSFRTSISINSSTNNREDKNTPSDTLNGTGTLSIDDSDILKLGVGINYLHNIQLSNNVLFYLGAGPYISINSEDGQSKEKYMFDPRIFPSKREISYFEFGVNFAIGVDWFLTKNISLSGEYEIYYFNRDYNFSYEDEYGKRTIDQANSGIDFNSVKLGVAVYF